ncbi:MAG: hypothetical protein LAO08_01525 [Acidobacteriia bacterium]|nr:hypothetical protein [Terriglobia bacterium]
MAIFETFSKRQKRLERAGQQDVYQYDSLPRPFRVQVVHILDTAIGIYYSSSGYLTPASKFWDAMFATMCRERGVFCLGDEDENHCEQCRQFVLTAATDGALDIIELSFRFIDRFSRQVGTQEKYAAQITQDANDAIEELNQRFREHGIGFQYVEGELVRVDSQFIHAEAIKPALSLLNQAGFDGPADEFMRAFEHYRHGRHKEAIAEALKSFESTMKAICKARNWPHPSNATAKPLMDTLFANGLIPPELESHFAGLRAAMESGLPTISNRTSRHGQGPDLVTIPPHIAAYALHLAASNIVLIVQAHNSLR